MDEITVEMFRYEIDKVRLEFDHKLRVMTLEANSRIDAAERLIKELQRILE